MTSLKAEAREHAERAILSALADDVELSPLEVISRALRRQAPPRDFSADELRNAYWHLLGEGRVVQTGSRKLRRAVPMASQR